MEAASYSAPRTSAGTFNPFGPNKATYASSFDMCESAHALLQPSTCRRTTPREGQKSGDFIPASRHVFPRPGQRFAEEHIADVAICESTDEAESTVAEARCEQKYEQENEAMTAHPKLKHPWLVAVWPGMGHVAVTAGYYLMAKLGMHLLTEFSPRELFEVEYVEVEGGLIRAGQLPRSRLFCVE